MEKGGSVAGLHLDYFSPYEGVLGVSSKAKEERVYRFAVERFVPSRTAV